MAKRIIIASHHARNDPLEAALREVEEYTILRVREKDELKAETTSAFNPDWIFVPHWSFIIPSEVHQAYRTVIFHMTDLPYGRGGSPLQNLILCGHTVTQLSALQCETGLDTGPIYLKRQLSLEGTAEEILRRANDLMLPMIRAIVDQDLVPVPQKGEPTAFKRRTPDQSALDDALGIAQVYDHIRMLDAEGYPHVFVETELYRIEFTQAQLEGASAVTATARIVAKEPDQ